MEPQSYNATNGSNSFGSSPCKCCPYGFHIDTDFVRYCDALLTTLYGNQKSINSSCRSFGSLRRKFNLNFSSYLNSELYPSSSDKSLMSYCDFNLQHNSRIFDSLYNDNHFTFKEGVSRKPHDCYYRTNGNRHFTSSNSIETDLSTPVYEAESMLSEAVNKFEEVFLESKSSSKCNLYQTSHANLSVKSEHDSPPPSPAPSSCHSSNISKNVLTQIRNHLALSLSRVKELENQVSQIPNLKEEILKLKSDRHRLQQKLKSQDDRQTDILLRIAKKINLFATNDTTVLLNKLKSIKDPVNNDHLLELIEETLQNHQTNINTSVGNHSITKCESISITDDFPQEPCKSFRSVGTLTSFAPCLPPRNAFVQTDLKSKDIITNRATKSVSTETVRNLCSISIQAVPDVHCVSTSTSLSEHIQKNRSQIDGNLSKDSNVQITSLDFPNKIFLDKSVSTSDIDVLHSVLRPTSLQLINDSSDHPNLIDSSSSTSSQSIRLCDKCHEMITSDVACAQDIPSITLTKIAKSDSGISVERKQMDHKLTEYAHNEILITPDSDLDMSCSDNTQLSEDSVYSPNKYRSNSDKKPFDYRNLQPNSEIKATLKIINEHLLDSKKTTFLFSKSVAFIKKTWFKISSSVDSDCKVVELYLDCFEKYSTKLLDYVVNLSDTNGNTAMHYAISYNNFDIVSVLLDSKVCDVNKYNKAGYTTTMLVSLAKIDNSVYRDVVERLFQQADVNMKAKQNGQTALMLAASHGRLEISKILLECGAEINLQDNDGSTALMCAAEHGHSEVISLLLSHPDCDPLIEDNEGSTALKIALVNGHNDIGVLLYAGTRTSTFFGSSLGSSLNQLPSSPLFSGHLRRTGSFSYSPSFSHIPYNSSVSLRNSPGRNRNASFSTPSSPSRT